MISTYISYMYNVFMCVCIYIESKVEDRDLNRLHNISSAYAYIV